MKDSILLFKKKNRFLLFKLKIKLFFIHFLLSQYPNGPVAIQYKASDKEPLINGINGLWRLTWSRPVDHRPISLSLSPYASLIRRLSRHLHPQTFTKDNEHIPTTTH